MATPQLAYYDDASPARSARPDITLVSDRQEVVAEVSSADTDSPELPRRIKMSARDFQLFVVAVEADREPNDTLKTAAERFKQKYG